MASKRKGGREWIGGLVTLPEWARDAEGGLGPRASIWIAGPTGEIVGMRPCETEHVTIEQLVEHFLETTRAPLQGKPHLPQRVRVASPELAKALRRAVPSSVEIVAEPLPELDQLARMLGEVPPEQLTGDETYFGPGLDAVRLGAFFRGAARFARAAPWNVVSAYTLIGVSSNALGVNEGVLAVLGKQTDIRSLVYFPDFAAYERNLRSIDASRGEEPRMTHQIILDLERAAEVPPSMRQEVVRHQWEVASPDAYPWVRVVDDDGEVRPGLPADLERMQVLGAAIGDLFQRNTSIAQQLAAGEVITHTCSVPLSDGRPVEVTLTIPFDETAGTVVDDEFDEVIEGFFESPEEQALGREAHYGPQVVDLALEDGRPLSDLDPPSLKRVLFDTFPAEVAVAPAEARTILEDTSAILRYLHRVGELDDLAGCLAVADPKHEGRLAAALGDTRRYSMAKSLILEGTRAGFDMSTEAGVRAFMARRGFGPPAGARGAKPNKRKPNKPKSKRR